MPHAALSMPYAEPPMPHAALPMPYAAECSFLIARHKDAVNTDDIIKNWLRNRNTIELLGFLEMLYNPDSKPVEFDGFRKQAELNSIGSLSSPAVQTLLRPELLLRLFTVLGYSGNRWKCEIIIKS